MRRFNASHHRIYDRTTPADGGAVPNTPGYELPGHRAAQCAISAHALAMRLSRIVDLAPELRDEAVKIALLVSEIPADVAVLQEAYDLGQRDLRMMCDEGIDAAREITRLRRELERYQAAPLPIQVSVEPRHAAAD